MHDLANCHDNTWTRRHKHWKVGWHHDRSVLVIASGSARVGLVFPSTGGQTKPELRNNGLLLPDLLPQAVDLRRCSAHAEVLRQTKLFKHFLHRRTLSVNLSY
eukprot:TRINITY_DN45613_c0_g1_i1.p1 TRINITY_DN45613_c0_g1~~TRINITY_DN45613_c0_g1_i1.p1  ORF type:complete len:103 (+),score=0.03 TRINITY_DN45613_c0_g1_i1:209-517(+)